MNTPTHTSLLALALILPSLGGCGLGLAPLAKDSGDTTALDGEGDEHDEDDGGGGSGSSDTGMSGSGGGSGGSGGDDGQDCSDDDGDGVDTCSGDCDDNDAATHPGAAEEDSASACMRDADGDGWGDASATSPIRPGTDCDDTTMALQPDDADGDGSSTCDGDCDDFDATRSPLESETPFDGVDSDCDGEDGGAIIVAAGVGPLTIRDSATTTSTASVGGCGTIHSVEVTLDITHSYQGDLSIELIGPSRVGATLHNRGGGGTDDIVGTYATTGGSLTPVDSLYVFTNEPGDGTWELEITDAALFDSGTLNSWSVTLWCSG